MYNVVYVKKKTGDMYETDTSDSYEEIVECFYNRISLAETLKYKVEMNQHPYTFANLIDNERPVGYFLIEEAESDDTSND
jgi:hypothetical protein